MSEKDIKASIRRYLKTVPCSKFFPYNPFYGESGIPDIVGMIQGKFVAFEVKYGNNTATKLQLQRIKEIQKAGGLAYVVWSVVEVIAIVEKLDLSYGSFKKKLNKEA